MKNIKTISILSVLMLSLLIGINNSSAATLATTLKGKILLQVEQNGEAWYVNPTNELRYYLGRPNDAFNIMRELGLGISNKDFDSFNGYAPSRLSGRILLKVADSGKAYYVNTNDLKMYYLGRPADAFNVMRELGLGITDKNLSLISVADMAGWKTATNAAIEFSFKYPSDWYVDDNLTLATCCLNITSYNTGAEKLFAGQTQIQVQRYIKPASQSLAAFASLPNELTGTSPKVEAVTVAGLQGVKSNALGDGIYYLPKSETEGIRVISWSHPDTKQASQTFTQQILSTFQFTQTKITILVPDNVTDYNNAMIKYIQQGGEDPLKSWSFVKKELSVPYTTDVVRVSAEAAAEELTTYGGPEKASIAYLKIQNGTAYVLLDIDLDGWAGVSVSIGRIHPLVEKTLLQFSQIKDVVFGFAPGDNRNNALL